MSIIHKLPFEWLVGLRYTRGGKGGDSNSSGGFISFISLISVAGIALGVAALIIVLSVLAHIEVFDARGDMPQWREASKEALRNPAVLGAAPFVQSDALLQQVDGAMRPAVIRGILPEAERNVSEIANTMREGRLESLTPGSFNIVLGYALAGALNLHVGDKVTMLLAQAQATPAGLLPRMRNFTVSGIFEAGHSEFDAGMAFISLGDAEKMERLGAPAGLRLKVADMHQAPQIAQQLKQSMSGDLVMRDWSQLNAVWFGAVQTEKKMMFIILTLIVTVAAFNLVSTLVMTVKDKQADIAILRTLGASPRSIMKIFVVQGTLVGVLGTVLGVGFGVVVALNVDVIVPFIERLFGLHFLSKDIYFISEIPSQLRWADVAWSGGVSVLLAFVATLYPSWSASRLHPADALRYE